jgi:hypothetical protein
MRRSLGISEPEAPRLEVTRMRRRHLRGVMAIERQVYPRPWSPNLFISEMAESRNRCYLVARMDKEIIGYGGLKNAGVELDRKILADIATNDSAGFLALCESDKRANEKAKAA